MLNDTEFSRKIYKELCEEFGDNFLEQPEESVFERAITAKDIVKYSSEEIDAIQKEYDKENCREIFQAYVEHRINQEEVLFLLNYYRDGMKAYREVYRGLYEIYGIPEQIACMNQLNGELEMHIQKLRKTGLLPFAKTSLPITALRRLRLLPVCVWNTATTKTIRFTLSFRL